MFGFGDEKREDPCAAAMNAYLRCVEGKTSGLREGDECIDEVVAYKKCRQLARDAKRETTKAALTRRATDGEQQEQQEQLR